MVPFGSRDRNREDLEFLGGGVHMLRGNGGPLLDVVGFPSESYPYYQFFIVVNRNLEDHQDIHCSFKN